jgi:type IV pilus assembly protein PilZ
VTDSLSTFHPRPRRLSIHLRIERSTLPAFLDSEIMNLSKGGVFIRTDIPLPTGSEIDFDFTLPNSGRKIRASGVVVWTRKRTTKPMSSLPNHPAGMGVQFRKIDTVDIDSMLNEIETLVEIT